MRGNASTRFLFGRAAPAAARAAAPPPRLLLDRAEAAEALHVCPRTLWTLTRDGQIPHLRLGRQVRYSLRALEQWVSEHSTVVPAPPAEAPAATAEARIGQGHEEEIG